MKELTWDEFYERLIKAGWSEKEAKEEVNRNKEGYYEG